MGHQHPALLPHHRRVDLWCRHGGPDCSHASGLRPERNHRLVDHYPRPCNDCQCIACKKGIAFDSKRHPSIRIINVEVIQSQRGLNLIATTESPPNPPWLIQPVSSEALRQPSDEKNNGRLQVLHTKYPAKRFRSIMHGEAATRNFLYNSLTESTGAAHGTH